MNRQDMGAQEYLRQVIFRQSDLRATRDAGKLTPAVQAVVERDARAGDLRAQLGLQDAKHDGLRRKIAAILKTDDRSTFTIASTGQVIKTPTVITTPSRDAKGKPTGSYQYLLFFDVPWDVFAEFVRRFLANVDRQMARYATLEGVLRLRDKYPQTSTPLEACQLEGIDPRSIDIPDDWFATGGGVSP